MSVSMLNRIGHVLTSTYVLLLAFFKKSVAECVCFYCVTCRNLGLSLITKKPLMCMYFLCLYPLRHSFQFKFLACDQRKKLKR